MQLPSPRKSISTVRMFHSLIFPGDSHGFNLIRAFPPGFKIRIDACSAEPASIGRKLSRIFNRTIPSIQDSFFPVLPCFPEQTGSYQNFPRTASQYVSSHLTNPFPSHIFYPAGRTATTKLRIRNQTPQFHSYQQSTSSKPRQIPSVTAKIT